MVTTFNPPARTVVKKKKKPVTPIVLGVACAVLAVLAIVLKGKVSSAESKSEALNGSLLSVAAAVGSDTVTAEALANPESAPAALESLTAAVTAKVAELDAAKAEAEKVRAEAERVQAELAAAQQAASDAKGQGDSAAKDLRTKSAELADLQKKYDADIAALKSQLAEAKAAAAAAAPVEATVDDAEANPSESASEETAPAATESTGEAATESGSAAAEVEPLVAGNVAGGKPERSNLFRAYQYDTASSNLVLTSIGGKKLTFTAVPAETATSLATAPVFDVFVRFKLVDVFASKPDARAFLLDLTAD